MAEQWKLHKFVDGAPIRVAVAILGSRIIAGIVLIKALGGGWNSAALILG